MSTLGKVDDRLERLIALKSAAESIADPASLLGKQARRELRETTLLTPEGIEFGLKEALEYQVGRATLSGLVRATPRAPRAHVLLSANVFTAPFRAIALALSRSPEVHVRPSRRSPTLTELLHEGSGEAFELVETLDAKARDHVYAYGSDETLKEVKAKLPPGVFFHAHGFGMGAAVFVESGEIPPAELAKATDALAQDICAFDQRGCLSPRVLLIKGSRSFGETVCNLLVQSLEKVEASMPRGDLDEQEQADALRHEMSMVFVGSCLPAGMGLVFLDPEAERIIVPPVGRYINATLTEDPVAALTRLADQLTNVSFFNAGNLPGQLLEKIGPRRYVDVGQMQKPAFDGPVDLRESAKPQLIS